MTNEQPEAMRLADAMDNCGLIVDNELRDQVADELRRLHELHVLYQDKVERLEKLCYDYLSELTALRAAKQMQARIDELKGVVRDWVPVSERLPKPGKYVLAVFRYSTGKQVVIRAMHAPPKTLSEDDYGEFVTEGADYDEATDTTYWPEGWYECNENEETHWQVHEEVTHWMLLPAAPSVGEKPDAERLPTANHRPALCVV
jgi:hypothetical protein